MGNCKQCNRKIRMRRKSTTGYCLECYQSVYLPSVRICDQRDPSSWKRNCPLCQKEIVYTTHSGYWCGVTRNSPCTKCASEKMAIERRRPPTFCKVCLTKELSRKNKVGMCGPCYTEQVKRTKQEGYSRQCPTCQKTITYRDKKRCQKSVGKPCRECKVKIPLLETKSCVFCGKDFQIDRRVTERLTCSEKCWKDGQTKARTTLENFLAEAKKVHGDMHYDYSKVDYKGTLQKVIITCKTHGDFLQFPQDHLTGSGCRKCKESHGEKRIRMFLTKHGIGHLSQHKFTDCVNPKSGRKLAFDYYIPQQNMVIEYDGEQHFRLGMLGGWKMTLADLQDIQYRDSIKTQYALTKNLKLVRITYKQLEQIEKILTTELL